MFVTEELSTMPAIDSSIRGSKSPSAKWVRAHIAMPLPVVLSDDFVWINNWGFRSRGRDWNRTGCSLANCVRVASPAYRRTGAFVIGLEDIDALQLLIEHSQRLKLLRLDHLFLKPILDFILPFFLDLLVGIIEMSVQLQ